MHTSTLTEAQCTGQRLMVGFNGTAFNDTLKRYIEDLKVGGLILFSRNIQSPQQVENLCSTAQEFAARCGQPPLFISIDQEGGVVSRLKPPFTQFKGNPHIKTDAQAAHFARITAKELRQIGVNMNMAPVLDVLPIQGPSVMADRSFGHNPHHVATLGNEVILHFQQNGIMAVAKHFPGIGRTALDSHQDLPDLDIEVHRLAQTDMIPFESAIKNQVAGIMLSHIRYPQVDPVWPASLSPTIAGEILRQQMAYTGLVLTDDLDMGAIAKHYDLPTVVQQGLDGQVDILLICHPGAKIASTCREITHQIQNSEMLTRRSIQSVARIMDAKNAYISV